MKNIDLRKSSLTEARKKKRSKVRVTHSTGYPAYDTEMFNRRFDGMPNGSWEIAANKDAEKVCKEIGTFASSGADGSNVSAVGPEISGGESGAMNEKLNKKIELFPKKIFDIIDLYDVTIEWRGFGKNRDQLKYFIFVPASDKRRLQIFDAVNKLNPYEAEILETGISFTVDSQAILEEIDFAKSNNTLTEAKRYVRRYYIKPINKFCSTKTDIINYLIEYNDQDCTIYTLNNLIDNDDVSKLTSKDIIYFYENGMLFDKNHMKLMDYELAVKNEEEREKIDIERASEKELKRVYADRIIGAEFEESISQNKIYESAHELDLDFDDVDIYGKTLRESKKEVCCICGEELIGYGNNPDPYKKSGKCCDACNIKFVIPARLEYSE